MITYAFSQTVLNLFDIFGTGITYVKSLVPSLMFEQYTVSLRNIKFNAIMVNIGTIIT